MRWWSFAILAYVAVAVQLGLGGYVSWGSLSPNLVLPVAVFIAINARREAALLGAFGLGLFQDLFTQSPLGAYALGYALVAMVASSKSAAVNRDHWLSHLVLTFFAALISNGLVWFAEWIYPYVHKTDAAAGMSLWQAFGGALYTGVLGPVILGLLSRAKRVFNFRMGRSAMMGRHSGAVRA